MLQKSRPDADRSSYLLNLPFILTYWYAMIVALTNAADTPQGNSNIDMDTEIKKAEEKLTAVNLNVEKLRSIQAKPDYEKTPQAVRDANAEKASWSVHWFLLHADPSPASIGRGRSFKSETYSRLVHQIKRSQINLALFQQYD